MKKLKIVLRYKYFYYILFIISIIYTVININFIESKSVFDLETKDIYGYVNDYNIDGYKLTIIAKDKEKILINYYFKSEIEKNNFKIKYGDYIHIKGDISNPKSNTNFNLFNYKNYLKSKKISYIMNAKSINIIKENNNVFYTIKNNIIKNIETKRSSNYLKTFILGDKRKIDNNAISSYQKLGISHLFAISGMHVSFLSMIILKILNKFNDNIKYPIVISFLIFYLFLTNYAVSIIRSTLQFILFYINKIFRLNIKHTNIILLIASILLIYNPNYIVDAGFLFSFIIAFNLIMTKDIVKNINTYISKSFIISVISFLSSLPILINNFYEINFLSILYNVFYIPFVSFILFPINLLTLVFPFLDNVNIFIINIFENVTIFLSNIKIFTFTASKIPFILIVIYYIVLYLIIFKIKRKTSYKNTIVILVLLILFIINNNRFALVPSITFLDVGQGDCSLIRIFDKNILIDTGGKIEIKKELWKEGNKKYNISDSIVLPYLKSIGVKKIDYLILTHGDYDHMGESTNLVNNFRVEKVIFNYGELNNLEKELINILDRKNIPYYSCIKELNIDKNKLYFLNTKEYDNENDNSSIIYTELNNYKFLFMGDASTTTEKEILDKYNLPNIDVLKVGHHGSKTSSGKEFINAINPKYSIISVGENNRYGHPNKEVLDNLNNSKIYRTDQDGSITFKTKNDRLQIEKCMP